MDHSMVSTFRQACEKGGSLRNLPVLPDVPLSKESKKEIKKEEVQEEIKEKTPVNMIKSSKHTPWIDTTNAKDLVLSPSMNPVSVHFQPPSTPSIHGVLTYCTCGHLCAKGQTQCSKCLLKNSPNLISGYLYELDKASTDKLNRFWYSLIGKDLYSKKSMQNYRI
jgi:hypothetical protein